MQIRPQETFPVLYQISDPSDSNTYYVRAVLRNSATGAILKVANLNYVNLTVDSGNSRRFSKNIQAPNDAAGTGFWMDVTISVYTDSGYTTKSTLYQENIDKYLVQERWNPFMASGGGGTTMGGMDKKFKEHAIDYAKIDEIVKGHVKGLDLPEGADLDTLSPHFEDIKAMVRALPKPQDIDLPSHTNMILDAIARHIASIDIPKVDLSPVLKRIDEIQIPEHPDYKPYFENLKSEIKDELKKVQDHLPDKRYTDVMDGLAAHMTGRTKEEDPNINRLKGLLS